MGKRWTPGPFPEFSWSHSRDECFWECSRKYYYQYYGFWRGWPSCDEGTEEQRKVYTLKCLTGLHQVLGSAVHRQAKTSVLAIQDKAERPCANEMTAEISRAIRQVCTTPREDFLADPKKCPITQSQYYRGRLDPDEIKGVRHKLPRCVQSLAQNKIWGEIENLDPSDVLVIDQLAQFDFGGTPVYVAVDFAAQLPSGEVMIVDWKTSTDDEAPVERQLALYALYLRDGLGAEWSDRWRGRVVNLVTGSDRSYTLTEAHLIRAEERIRDGVARMHELLLDDRQNEPLEKEHFPLINRALRYRCSRCPYFELCRDELSPHARQRNAEALPGNAPAGERDACGTVIDRCEDLWHDEAGN